MIAYKFLAAGATGPFTGCSWPVPGPRTPGPWLAAPAGDLARYGVHACALEDLSSWPDEELWLVELSGTVLREASQLVAARGRLLERIAAWNAESAHDYAAACAWRARDLAVEALGGGVLAAADALRACTDLVSLQATATALAGDVRPGDPRALVAYVAGAAIRARQGRYPEASLQSAHLGAALAGTDVGAEHERAWQSRWLAERLQLRDVEARAGVDAPAV
ncbi:MAG: hypothetical protein ACJ79R_14400 [Anaeromyxobacteraceae bacterium]